MNKIIQHTEIDTVTMFVNQNKLCIKSKATNFGFVIDVETVYDLLAESMSIDDPNPGVSRRAKQMRQIHPDIIAPGPFMSYGPTEIVKNIED